MPPADLGVSDHAQISYPEYEDEAQAGCCPWYWLQAGVVQGGGNSREKVGAMI